MECEGCGHKKGRHRFVSPTQIWCDDCNDLCDMEIEWNIHVGNGMTIVTFARTEIGDI